MADNKSKRSAKIVMDTEEDKEQQQVGKKKLKLDAASDIAAMNAAEAKGPLADVQPVEGANKAITMPEFKVPEPMPHWLERNLKDSHAPQPTQPIELHQLDDDDEDDKDDECPEPRSRIASFELEMSYSDWGTQVRSIEDLLPMQAYRAKLLADRISLQQSQHTGCSTSASLATQCACEDDVGLKSEAEKQQQHAASTSTSTSCAAEQQVVVIYDDTSSDDDFWSHDPYASQKKHTIELEQRSGDNSTGTADYVDLCDSSPREKVVVVMEPQPSEKEADEQEVDVGPSSQSDDSDDTTSDEAEQRRRDRALVREGPNHPVRIFNHFHRGRTIVYKVYWSDFKTTEEDAKFCRDNMPRLLMEYRQEERRFAARRWRRQNRGRGRGARRGA